MDCFTVRTGNRLEVRRSTKGVGLGICEKCTRDVLDSNLGLKDWALSCACKSRKGHSQIIAVASIFWQAEVPTCPSEEVGRECMEGMNGSDVKMHMERSLQCRLLHFVVSGVDDLYADE